MPAEVDRTPAGSGERGADLLARRRRRADDPATPGSVMVAYSPERVAAGLFRLSIGVFFIGGFVAALISLLVPRVRLTLGLDYAGATAIQLGSHSSYLLLALPIAAVVAARGYMRAHAIGLGLMAVGCGLIVAGFAFRSFAGVLAALLVLSAGSSFLQIASNTAVTLVGDPARAAFRLNLLQGFNAIGTVAGPLVGAPFVLAAGAADRIGGAGLPALVVPFGLAGLVLAGLAIAFFRDRDLLRGLAPAGSRARRADWIAALRDTRLRHGAVAIFAYVGAEVAIGALLTDFLMLPHALALAPVPAARLVALYWGAAMLGRFAGAALLRRIAPGRLLAAATALAVLLIGAAVAGHGIAAAAALIAVGLANSIMYPTIYVLALPARPEQATPGATLLCMAVVGGAVIPPLTGFAADRFGLVAALALPALCYLVILDFARRHPRPRASD